MLQAFLLGLCGAYGHIDWGIGTPYLNRPIILGPLVGLILGDLTTGIIIGGTLEVSPYGEARFQIPALCALQRHQVCLPMGPNLCCIPCKKAGGGQTLQHCAFSRCQEAGAAYFCYGEIQAAVLLGNVNSS